eukprot:1253962-Rhodomonas_salina.1
MALGYPGTSGATFFDYNVTYPVVAEKTWCTENRLEMPHLYQMNSHRLLYPKIRAARRQEEGMPVDKFVFCIFGRLGRIEPALMEAWVNILNRVQNSVLCLLELQGIAKIRLLLEFEKRWVTTDRVQFLPPLQPKQAHLERVAAADVFLDTLTYNGHTTASDALWARIPVVTCTGDNWPARVATALQMENSM